MNEEKVAKEFASAYEAGFLQGVKYGYNLKWIKLKEEKPAIIKGNDISEWLFIRKADGEHTIGHMFADGRFTEAHTGAQITNVSHWMYMEK